MSGRMVLVSPAEVQFLRAPALRADVVYLSPRGRRCRWLPLGGPRWKWGEVAYFEYLDARGRAAIGAREAFVLTAANYRILREAGPLPDQELQA